MKAWWLAVRSLVWTLLLPGLVAGYVPWAFFGVRRAGLDWSRPRTYAGVLAIAAGAGFLLACIWEFARRGRGTLSPLDPPRELVVRGVYRYVRNPMYLAVALILTGELLLVPSRGLLLYAVVWFVWVNLFVLAYEEPALRRQFGASYEHYVRRVRRWLPAPPRPGV